MSTSVRIAICLTAAIAVAGLLAFVSVRSGASIASEVSNIASVASTISVG